MTAPLLLAACGDDGPTGSTELLCGAGTSGTLTASAMVAVTDASGEDLVGASVAVSAPSTAIPNGDITIDCGDDIVPTGYTALGPAVTFGPLGSWSDRAFTVTLPYKAARLPENTTYRHVRIVAKRHIGDGTSFFPPVANKHLDDEDPYASRVSFRAGELITYQAVVADDAGQTEMREFKYRAIIGISMGGNASLSIGLRNNDRFDVIGDLGGEPGPSMKYSMSFIREFLFGGFCTAQHEIDGIGNVGNLCTNMQRSGMNDQHEITADYDHMIYQDGLGVGLTLKRDLYMKAMRDMSRSFGNPAHYNIDNPYTPPGVPLSFTEVDAATRCANPIVLKDFYDQEFNPNGTYDVITYCDGGDSPTLGLGVWDQSLPQTNPAEVLLAVDINGNGQRDAGEPVITNAHEPYEDIGTDGVADVDETGVLGAYDAVTNPDPAGDNYHYLRNPLGTEGNWDWDEGEPYEDIGIDGVASTCQQGDSPGTLAGCYDWGEGDGKWSLHPNLRRWYDSDLDEIYKGMTDQERRHMSIWMDAGIRDFLNAAVSANAGAGLMSGKFGLSLGVFDNFGPLQGPTIEEGRYDFVAVDWAKLPQRTYVRYGDPDATQSKIDGGDGRHVGTGPQLAHRVVSSFAFLSAQWPGGDREFTGDAGEIEDFHTFTAPTSGRETPFSLFLPPGYDEPENAGKTYPVVYFLHGYGQSPEDLVLVSAIFENYMINPDIDESLRFQKLIIVYVDGRCRPNRSGVPVEPGGDNCEQGTFYMDAPLGGDARMETNMLELMDHIDATYRTKAPEMVPVIK